MLVDGLHERVLNLHETGFRTIMEFGQRTLEKSFLFYVGVGRASYARVVA